MACGKRVSILISMLACLAYTLAEEGSTDTKDAEPSNNESPLKSSSEGANSDPGLHERAGIFGLPTFSELFGGSNGSDPFSQIAAAFSQFMPGLDNSSSSIFPNFFTPFLPHGRAQQVELPGDLNASDSDSLHPQDRFFFHFFHHHRRPSNNNDVSIGCNYTTEPGYRCAGCREQLLCNSNNVGRLQICPSYAPYCYNGVCGTFVNSTCTNSTG